MNSTKPLIKLGARLTNNNYHLFTDKDMNGLNNAIYSILYLSYLIALFFDCCRLNQIGEKIRFGVFTFTVSTTVFSLEPHCSHDKDKNYNT